MEETMRLERPHDKPPSHASSASEPPHEATRLKRAAILDMGEASREQGFRENGCR